MFQFLVDLFWLGSFPVILVGVILGFNGVEGWWIVLLVGVAMCAGLEAYNRLSGTHRRRIEAAEKSIREKQTAVQAEREEERARILKEFKCPRCHVSFNLAPGGYICNYCGYFIAVEGVEYQGDSNI